VAKESKTSCSSLWQGWDLSVWRGAGESLDGTFSSSSLKTEGKEPSPVRI